MKVEIHNLKHEKWFIDAEPSETIESLKQRNISEHKMDDSLNQKMIYSGTILKDTDTLEGIKYVEGKGFIVCMASKKKKPALKQQESAPEATVSKSAESESQGDVSSKIAPADEPKSESLVPSKESGFMAGPSALATGEQFKEVIENIKNMGYSQQQVLSAMRRAFNNPDRAVEYLVNGDIPSESDTKEPAETQESSTDHNSTSHEQREVTNAAEAEKATSIDHDLFDAADQQMMEDEEDEVEEEIDFRELLGLDDQQMEELRAAVRQNPDQVVQLLQPLIHDNPVIAETLVNNIDQFMWYLTTTEEDLNESDLAPSSEPGSHVISIAPEEENAIRRLMELGFEWEIVATAYLACDKDEQLTANYLFEHGHEE